MVTELNGGQPELEIVRKGLSAQSRQTVPIVGIGRRFELIGVENPPGAPWRCYRQHESQCVARTLKIGHANAVNPEAQLGAAIGRLRLMNAVVINHSPVVYIEPGTVVGIEKKLVRSRLIDPEFPSVIDAEPFDPIRDTWKAFFEIARGDIQFSSVDGAHGFELLEVRQLRGTGRQVVDIPTHPTGYHHRSPKCWCLTLDNRCGILLRAWHPQTGERQ